MNTDLDTVKIRFSALKDAGKLMELDHQVWDHRTAPQPLVWESREQYLLHCPPGQQLVAETGDGTLAGYLGFKAPTELDSNQHVYELWIAVDRQYRRRGIGVRLMTAFKAFARRESKLKLRLRVLSSNEEAVAFYQSCGFQEEGRLVREYHVKGQYVDDILMACFL